jgi:molybdenum cofactor guanylyltransferase
VKRLGAIIAGGQSMRFGSDKALALLDGRPLIQHVVDGLHDQVDQIIICGRDWPGLRSVADRPTDDLGPLGGINAALYCAQQNGFDAVVTAGCDVLPVPRFPDDLADGKAAYIVGHYLFGIWPVSLSETLNQYLAEQSDRSMRGWIAAIGARELPATEDHRNLNTPDDLAQFARNHEAATCQ